MEGKPIKDKLDIFDILIGAVLVIMILLAPMPFGSVAPWAQSALFILTLLATALWLLQCACKGRLRLCPSPLWLFIPLLGLIIGFQLVPLAPETIQSISPATDELYAKTLPGYTVGDQARTLSLDPHSTLFTLARWGMFALVLLVVMNTVRFRGQIVALTMALLVTGLFQALYGFSEQFSGHSHIFWNARQFHLGAVTGTFHNKNHFAGLLEMIVPVVLGLSFAVSARVSRSPSMGRRMFNFFAASGTQRQVILILCMAVMATAIFFSLSRAGIVCVVASWAVFAGMLCFTSGLRRYTLVLPVLLGVVLCIAAGIGAEVVITSMEDAVSGDSTSWTERADLWQSGLAMTQSYFQTGTGLGTFSQAFEQFQSMYFGDRLADYLHNDWLQLFTELGLVGGLLIVAGALFTLYRLIRKTVNCKDAFRRWIAFGSMAGVFAILLHSFFDYNLYKITSNGIVFAVILGLWHVSVNLSRDSGDRQKHYWSLASRPYLLGWIGAAALIAALVLPGEWAYRKGMADVHFNRFVTDPMVWGKTDSYHFLPAHSSGDRDPAASLDEALTLDPLNPRYHYFKAVHELVIVDEKLEKSARASAQSLLGPDTETVDPDGFRTLIESMAKSLKAQVVAENLLAYEKAEALLERAIRLSPGVALYHTRLAEVVAQARSANEAIQMAETALWLSPTKPSVLFEMGKIFTEEGILGRDSADQEEILDFAILCFRRALYADPDYTNQIYPLVRNALGGKQAMVQVTPKTLLNYNRLIQTLWEDGLWVDVLSCLDTSMKIMEDSIAREEETSYLMAVEESEPDSMAKRFLHGSPEEILRSLSEKRCTVLGILGDWSKRAIEVNRYSQHARTCVDSLLDRARLLRKNGRCSESFTLCLELLQGDWKNRDVLVEAAELATLPSVPDDAPPWNRSIDFLFRLILTSDSLDSADLQKMEEVFDSLFLEEPMDCMIAELIRGAALVLAGRSEAGMAKLQALSIRLEEEEIVWRQQHLVAYFLGLGYEKVDQKQDAAAAYQQVLRQVPTHLASLERLALFEKEGLLATGTDSIESGELTRHSSKPGESTRRSLESGASTLQARLAAITPGIPCSVSFGGKVTLLGLSLTREQGEGEDENWYLSYHWVFNDRMPEGYHPIVHFCDENWQTLFQDDHHTRFMDRPYPVDFPRSGEVIVDRRRLHHDPTRTCYMRIGYVTDTPERSGPKYLQCDSGDELFLITSHALLEKEEKLSADSNL